MTSEGGTLFVVATPIGNLGDITLRAIETLRSCDGVLAEDTRRTRHLLTHLGIQGKRVDRMDAHANPQTIERALERLSAGEQLAVVTDAGTPSVSDPGDNLVQAAIDRGVRVVPIPGASSVLCALVASGMAGDGRFRFVGFLPRDGKKRREALETVTETPEVSILFEAPSRLQATLVDLAGVTPNRKVCIARELTKVHEELVHGTCADLAAQERTWLGEVVLVLGHHVPADRAAAVSDEEIDAVIDQALAKGEASRIVAERLATWSGRSRRDMYERILARKR